MATVSKESYLRLIENRPYKFDAEEVNYRDSVEEGEEHYCHTCIHFFERHVDRFHTCEIFRPENDASVDPDYLCDFWNDGTTQEPSSTS